MQPHYLQIIARPLNVHECIWMHVSIDNVEIATIPTEKSWTQYMVHIPDWLPPVEGRILLSFQPLWTPADLGINADGRILSAAIHRIAWI